MTCPICGGKNCDYWPDGVYCRQCKAKHPYPKTDLEATIDAVLAGCISLCLDNAADVAALKGALLGALREAGIEAPNARLRAIQRRLFDLLERAAIVEDGIHNDGPFITDDEGNVLLEGTGTWIHFVFAATEFAMGVPPGRRADE